MVHNPSLVLLANCAVSSDPVQLSKQMLCFWGKCISVPFQSSLPQLINNIKRGLASNNLSFFARISSCFEKPADFQRKSACPKRAEQTAQPRWRRSICIHAKSAYLAKEHAAICIHSLSVTFVTCSADFCANVWTYKPKTMSSEEWLWQLRNHNQNKKLKWSSAIYLQGIWRKADATNNTWAQIVPLQNLNG